MNETTIALEPVDDAAIPYVTSLLERNGLPSQDVEPDPDRFYIARDGTERVGIGGLEVYGSDGLLRSVVVERSARGNGVGTAICDALESEASERGAGTLYLLTTTATEFFASRGYVEIGRADAPDTVRGTPEFEDLCPATATCMKKSLSPTA